MHVQLDGLGVWPAHGDNLGPVRCQSTPLTDMATAFTRFRGQSGE